MRTIRTKVYKFKELSTEAQEKAIEKFYDINVDHDWWDSTYEDAKNIGLKIKSFDLGRGRYCKGEFLLNAYEVSGKIVQEHGEGCETYKTAVNFGLEWDKLVEKYSDGIDKTKVTEDNEYDFDKEA